ncbi:MAG: hypothetical protein V7638_4889 [Acidobacteriota bacterium]|jgi:hypothetical protein
MSNPTRKEINDVLDSDLPTSELYQTIGQTIICTSERKLQSLKASQRVLNSGNARTTGLPGEPSLTDLPSACPLPLFFA